MGVLSVLQVEMFASRLAGLEDVCPGYAYRFGLLSRRLLSFGGVAVVPTFEPDELLVPLLARVEVVSGRDAVRVPMRRSDCHRNVRALAAGGVVPMPEVWSGYALSDDGLWRAHSWVVSDGRVVETTEPRVLYAGVRVEV